MNKMIKELISVHKQESILSKKLKKLKEDVRDYMQKNNLSFITNEDGEVLIKEVEQTSFNEDKLIPWLEENYPECLVVKTVIDYDMLDKVAFEDKKLPQELIAFQVVKKSQRMDVKYVKD
jgi:UDP-N-acetylglucosamine 2-epimerase